MEPTLPYRFQFTISRALSAIAVLAVGLSILPTAYDNWIVPSPLDGETNYFAFGLFAGTMLGGCLGTLIAGHLGFVVGFFVGALAGSVTALYIDGFFPSELSQLALFGCISVASVLMIAWGGVLVASQILRGIRKMR